MTARAGIVLCLIAALAGAARPTRAQEREANMTGITVQGTGAVQVKPDIARLTLGVQTQATDSSTAARENAERTTRVIDAVKSAGVAEKDIQTANYSIHPQYENRQREPGRFEQVLSGYQVSNSVRIVVRRIGDVGKVIDAAVQAGANVAAGVHFDLEDSTKAKEEALRRAVADALRKGRVIADAASVPDIRLAAISEGVFSYPRPLGDFAARGVMAAEAAPTPVQPGEQTITATVTARFTLQPSKNTP